MVIIRRAVRERIMGFDRSDTDGDDEKDDGKETMLASDCGYKNECEEKFGDMQTAGGPDLDTGVGER